MVKAKRISARKKAENAREKEAICVNNPRTAVEDLSDVRSLAKSVSPVCHFVNDQLDQSYHK